MTEQTPGRAPSELSNAFEDRPRVPVSRPKFVPKDTTPLTYEQNLKAVQAAQGVLSTVFATSSLDAVLPGSDDESFSLSAVVADPRVDIEGEVERNMQIGELRDALAFLPTRSRTAVSLHFLEGKTYDEVGKELGISRGRIRQIIEKSLGILKQYMNGEISGDKVRNSAPSRSMSELRRINEEDERARIPAIESVRPVLGKLEPHERQLIEEAYSGGRTGFKDMAERYKTTPSAIARAAQGALRRAHYLMEEQERERNERRQEAHPQKREDWNPSQYRNDPDIQPGPNGELSPLLQRLVDDMSRALMQERAEFKRAFPTAFFPNETMTDAERQIFLGRRNLQDPEDFPKLCSMWGLTSEEGESLYKAAEQKYYTYALD